MLTPLGDFPHAKGLQRIDAEVVRQLVDEFSTLPARLGRLFVGVPFYIGHPDVPGLENEYPDRKAYGWVTALAQKPDGLYATVKWSKAGAEMIAERHYRFLSPYWSAKPVARAGTGMIYRPTKLISVGLTNTPNLPVLPLENTASTKPDDSTLWIGLALPIDGTTESSAAEPSGSAVLEEAEPISIGNSEPSKDEFQEMGINLKTAVERGSDSQKLERERGAERRRISPVDLWRPRQTALSPRSCEDPIRATDVLRLNNNEEETNMNQNEQNERAVIGENRVTALKIEAVLALLGLPETATLNEVKQRVEGKPLEASHSNAASGALPNESARVDWPEMETRMQKLEERLINSVVDQAIREGRTTPAQRAYWSAQLAEDFEGKSVELANAAPVLKTGRRRDDLKGEAERHSERASASAEVLRLVQVKMDQGLNYDRAWCAVKEENQNLFATMDRPERGSE